MNTTIPGIYFGGGGGTSTIAPPASADAAVSRGQSAITGTVRVTDRYGAVPDPSTRKKLFNAQIAYENLADMNSIAQAAVQMTNEARRQHEDKTIHLRKRWRLANHMYRGNTIANTWGLEDTHVPEIYKGIETLIPRMEEAVLRYDPFFSVQGRDRMDRMRQGSLQAWYEWQLHQAKFERMVQPSFRSMLIYQFAMKKIWWALETQWQVVKEVKENFGPNGIEYQIAREYKEVVTYDGPKTRLVDPYDSILDTSRGYVEDMLRIGDTCYMTSGQILDIGEKRGWKNLDKLRDMRPAMQNSSSQYDKSQRSLTERFQQGRKQPTGSPEVYRVTELWGKMKFLSARRNNQFARSVSDLDETEVVLTVIEDSLCVEARENFHDDKHRPYAIARCAKEDWDFFNVGPLDHAMPLNANLDQHRNLATSAHALSQCPLVFTEDDSDMPPSMLGVAPGSVFRSMGKVTFGAMPNTLGNVPMIEGMIKQDITETMGAPKIFEGSSSGEAATATEISRKIEEANRRIRGIILSYSMCTEDVLDQFHALSRQFVTSRQAFRVLGKDGKRFLGAIGAISPTDLDNDVDFRMVGVAGLHTMGTRATSLVRFMNIAAPFMEKNPGVVKEDVMIRDLYDLTVGMRPGEDVVRVQTSAWDLVSADEESMMFAQGQQVPVDPLDDDEEHIEVHVRQLTNNQDMPGLGEKYLVAHIMEHAEAAQRKQREEAIREQQQEIQAMSDPRMQSQENVQMGSPSMSPTGENPGPADANKYGKPGKKTPMMQDENDMGSSAA